jgi:hypothetical protein
MLFRVIAYQVGVQELPAFSEIALFMMTPLRPVMFGILAS